MSVIQLNGRSVPSMANKASVNGAGVTSTGPRQQLDPECDRRHFVKARLHTEN